MIDTAWGGLFVQGNLSVAEGTYKLSRESRTEIQGDLHMEGSGRLNMTENIDRAQLTVHGDLLIDSSRQSVLKYGSLILDGDFIQKDSGYANSLSVIDYFTINFKGSSVQKIRLANPDISLGTLDFRESKGIDLPEEIHARTLYGFRKIQEKEFQKFYLSNVSLSEDDTVYGRKIQWYGDYLDTGVNTLHFAGDVRMAVSELIDTTWGGLSVQGNLSVVEGTYKLSRESSTEIQGDLRMEGSGKLSMNEYLDAAQLTVHGDLVIDSTGQTSLRYGSLTLGGSFLQTEDADTENLIIGSSFSLLLNGSGTQTIDLPGVDEIPYLNLSQSRAVRLMQDFSGETLTGVEKIVCDGDTLYLDYRYIDTSSNGTLDGNLKCFGKLNVNGHTLSITGNYTQYDGTWIQNGGTLSVAGDFIADQGLAMIEEGLIRVKGDTRIKKNGGVEMRGRESCRFLAEGDYFSACRNIDYGRWYTGGTLELRGDLIKKDVASSFGLCLDKTKVVFSGDKIQTVKVPDNVLFGEAACIDMRSSIGVDFCGASLKANQIIGFSKIQSGGMLNLYKSRVTLIQDEEFSGIITMSDTYLDCNGYEFRISDGGNLEQTDGLVNLDHGTLYVDGDYILHCNSILQMIQMDDLLQVKGNFETQSFMNHSSMLRNGRMELWGNFNQGGDKTAFASSENFVIAFMGSGQTAHFDDVGYSRFANIDPDHSSVKIKDERLVFWANVSMSVGRGVVSGLQEALGDLELSASAAAVSTAIGISLSAIDAPVVVAVVAVLSLIAAVIGTIQSLFMIAQSAGGIYSTATGTGTIYDKLEAFAHDFIIMVVGIVTLKGSVKTIEASLSSFKSAAQELFGRKSRLTPSEVTQTYKGAKLVTSFDDFAEYAKGFLDDDALKYAKEVLGNDGDDTAKLKKVAQLVEDGSKKIGKKLSKEELKAGLDALWNDGGVEGALAAIGKVSKAGTKLRNGYEFGKLSVEPEDLQKTAERAAGEKIDAVNALDGSRFSRVKDIDSFLESIPADSTRLPWEPNNKIPEGVDKFVWTDENGNKWFAECHGPDSSAAPGKNASTGWVYRIQVKINGSGRPFYMATDGKFYSVKLLEPTRANYIESLANDTHIPINGR